MSHLINSDFSYNYLLEITKVYNNKFSNEKRTDRYRFFNIVKLSEEIFKVIFAKDY